MLKRRAKDSPARPKTIGRASRPFWRNDQRILRENSESPMLPLPNRGRHHDLDLILADLRVRYFPDCTAVTIRWGRWSGRTRTRSIRFGAYLPGEKLIRIHPALDQVFVPRSFVDFIVYHHPLPTLRPPAPCDGKHRPQR